MPSNWGKTDSTKLQTEDSNQCDMICVMSVLVFYLSPDIEKESINTPRTNRLSNMAIRTCKKKIIMPNFGSACGRTKLVALWNAIHVLLGKQWKHLMGCPRKASIPACKRLAWIWAPSRHSLRWLSQCKGRGWWMGVCPVARKRLVGGLQGLWHEVRFYFPSLLIISRGE